MHTTLITVAVLALLAPPVETSPARTTRLYVRTLPPGASIKLDGRPRGVGDQLFVVPPGVNKVTVEVEWDPGETQQRVVQIEGGRITRAEFQWSPPEQKTPQPQQQSPQPAPQAPRLRVVVQPPVVVHTEPSSGDRAVDPSTSEIRVTFSKEMTDGSWSWTSLSPETFLETKGEPSYLPDKRTCVLPVKLEPGRVYATWLNSQTFGNFQDTEGRPAVPYLLIFETADKLRGRPWGPEQATGAPDTPQAGHLKTAWAPMRDFGAEWLVLSYAEPIRAGEVRVYETSYPGALEKVTVFRPDGKEVVAWEGKDPTDTESPMGVSKIPIHVDFDVQQVKLYLRTEYPSDPRAMQHTSEIDAVGLVDPQGKEHFATWAAASSMEVANAERHERAPLAVHLDYPAGFKIAEDAIELSYFDESRLPDAHIVGGRDGGATAFDRPDGPKKLVAVQIFASTYDSGSQVPEGEFHVVVLDGDKNILGDFPFPFSMISRPADNPQWHTLALPGFEVPERFFVAICSGDRDRNRGGAFSKPIDLRAVPAGQKHSYYVIEKFSPAGERTLSLVPAGSTGYLIRAWLINAPAAGQSQESAAATIAQLKNALQAYRLDLGVYPTGDQGLNALRERPADLAKPDDWKGPYLKDAAPLDPWGAAYQYRSPGKKDAGGFDLWSFGPDGVDGTEDDVAE